jgi:hypothetical protein
MLDAKNVKRSQQEWQNVVVIERNPKTGSGEDSERKGDPCSQALVFIILI